MSDDCCKISFCGTRSYEQLSNYRPEKLWLIRRLSTPLVPLVACGRDAASTLLSGKRLLSFHFFVYVLGYLRSYCDRGSPFVSVEICRLMLVGWTRVRSRMIGLFPDSNNMVIASYSGTLEEMPPI